MIRAIHRNTTASIAMCAALACGSPALFAQDAAVSPAVDLAPSVETAPPAAAEVAPPPAVRTISDEMLGQPVAPAVVEKAAARRAIAKAAPAKAVSPPKVAAVPVADVAEDALPVAKETIPTIATVEDTAMIAPIEQPVAEQPANDVSDDWMIYGGLAAALGLAGLGAGVAARRRRGRVNINSSLAQTIPASEPDYAAARPVTIARPVAAPSATQPSFAVQHMPPVTDPLFAHQATLAPITDPLFSHKAVASPIIDPIFAGHSEYVGRLSTFDTRRSWPSGPKIEQPTVRELEPTE